MKIGEIKKQSLLLIFPEIPAHFDSESDESVNEGISELKCDPSIRSYLEGSVPAINRALCEIEKVGATKTRRVTVNLKDVRGAIDLSETIPDLLSVLSIYQSGKALKYNELDSYILLDGASAGETEVVYKSKVERVRYITEDAREIDLDYGVCALIPYFVASELCEAENSERSRTLRAKFFEGLGAYNTKTSPQSEVEAVYSW